MAEKETAKGEQVPRSFYHNEIYRWRCPNCFEQPCTVVKRVMLKCPSHFIIMEFGKGGDLATDLNQHEWYSENRTR